MHGERRDWLVNARQKAKELLHVIHEEYAAHGEEKAAAIVEEILARFESSYMIRRNNARSMDGQIRALHEQGLSVSEIADQLDLGYQRVHDRLTRVLGLTPHRKYVRRSNPDGPSRETAAEDQAFLEMYQQGLSIGDIAAGAELSRQRIHQRIQRALGGKSLMDVRAKRETRRGVFFIAADTDVLMKKRNMKKVDNNGEGAELPDDRELD